MAGAAQLRRRDGLAESRRGRSIPALLVFGSATALAAFVGARLTSTSVDSWYRDIRKPRFNPPSWVFGPVWTVLYVAMAIAAWLVWRRGPDQPVVKRATTLFGVQLGLNTLWPALFFGARSPLAGLIDICVLLSAIVAWFRRSAEVDQRTRWLILPYLAWTGFAAVLNARIWWLNR